MFEILGADHGRNIFRVNLRFNSPRRLKSFFLHIKSHFNIIHKMALYTVVCFIKFDLINNGFSIIHEDDISIQLVRVIIIIQKMMLLRMKKIRRTHVVRRYHYCRSFTNWHQSAAETVWHEVSDDVLFWARDTDVSGAGPVEIVRFPGSGGALLRLLPRLTEPADYGTRQWWGGEHKIIRHHLLHFRCRPLLYPLLNIRLLIILYNNIHF
jgi:hypothetical protein